MPHHEDVDFNSTTRRGLHLFRLRAPCTERLCLYQPRGSTATPVATNAIEPGASSLARCCYPGNRTGEVKPCGPQRISRHATVATHLLAVPAQVGDRYRASSAGHRQASVHPFLIEHQEELVGVDDGYVPSFATETRHITQRPDGYTDGRSHACRKTLTPGTTGHSGDSRQLCHHERMTNARTVRSRAAQETWARTDRKLSLSPAGGGRGGREAAFPLERATLDYGLSRSALR